MPDDDRLDRLEDIVRSLTRMMAVQHETNEAQREMNQQQREMNARLEAYIQRQDAMNQRMEALLERLTRPGSNGWEG